jgi:hypothetical protein
MIDALYAPMLTLIQAGKHVAFPDDIDAVEVAA